MLEQQVGQTRRHDNTDAVVEHEVLHAWAFLGTTGFAD
jgi:hypothetical protein